MEKTQATWKREEPGTSQLQHEQLCSYLAGFFGHQHSIPFEGLYN